MASPLLDPWRPGIETYHRLAEEGFFEDVRVELLDGIVVRMSPRSAAHDYAIQFLTRLVVEATPSDVAVRIQSALSLDENWETEPDVAIVEPGSPATDHPSHAGLAIEVSDTSLRRDVEIKAAMYARFAIAEYWIVDLNGRRVIGHRDPTPDGYG